MTKRFETTNYIEFKNLVNHYNMIGKLIDAYQYETCELYVVIYKEVK